MVSKTNYGFVSWGQYFADNVVSLKKLDVDESWKEFFDEEMEKTHVNDLEEYLSHCLKVTGGKVRIFPYPELVFNAFNLTKLPDIKVVILGQDPYHGFEVFNDVEVPQAMGLSFSVPAGIIIPSSLVNIFNNQFNFGRIKNIPKNGNLTSWAQQGCLMLNSALTVQYRNPNSHADYWVQFTDNVIKYLSRVLDNIVFVLWGSPALKKLNLIDQNKHLVVISSHPSGLSYNKYLRSYLPFNMVDHFGLINAHLKKIGKTEIDWQLS